VVKFSYLEIYNEQVRDMLSKNKTKSLSVTEDPQKGVQIQDLKEVIIRNLGEA